MSMTLTEGLRFDAREPDRLGGAKTMAVRLVRAADAIDHAQAENDRLRHLLSKLHYWCEQWAPSDYVGCGLHIDVTAEIAEHAELSKLRPEPW